jgi:hypothetical protein
MSPTPRHINDIIDEITHKISDKNKTIQCLIDVLHERGFGILIFIFALPMALPLPVPPGVNLLFAVPLLFLTAQQILMAKQPWFPKTIRNKTIDPNMIKRVLIKSKPLMGKLSILIRPRLAWVTHGLCSRLIGVFGFLFALCVCIPIPMTNTVPSFAILLMAVGVLMRDGLAVLGGMIVGSLWVLMLATLGVAGFQALLSYLL